MTSGQWERTTVAGVRADAVAGLAIMRDKSDDIALAATRGGLLASRDGGKHWGRAPGRFGTLPFMAVALSPSSNRDLLAFAGTRGGVCWSPNLTDWTLSQFPTADMQVVTIVPSPAFPLDGIVLAGTMGDGVLRSEDRGQTFAAWNFGLLDREVMSLALSPRFSDDRTALAATATGVFRSTNGGRAWTETSLVDVASAILSVTFSPRRDRSSAVAVDESGGVHISDDHGLTWHKLSTPLDGRSLNAVVVPSDETATMAIAHDAGVHISTDGGATWHGWRAPASALCLAATRIEDRGGIVLLAGLAEGGIYRREVYPVST